MSPRRNLDRYNSNLKFKTMKEFLLVSRADYETMSQLSPEEMQANTPKWMNGIGIAAQGKLADRSNRLTTNGKIVINMQ